MNESKMCEWHIERLRGSTPSREGEEWTAREWQFQREVPYNHYGDRGVLDLVAYRPYERGGHVGATEYKIVEFKSDAAIEQASGPNDILRQFNRHRRYFWEDESHGHPVHNPRELTIDYELMFAPTPKAVEHVLEYTDTYCSLEYQKEWAPFRSTPAVRVAFCFEPEMDYLNAVMRYSSERRSSGLTPGFDNWPGLMATSDLGRETMLELGYDV